MNTTESMEKRKKKKEEKKKVGKGEDNL